MVWKLNFAREARKDLREIAAFIARNNPERVRTFTKLLSDKARSLKAHPEMGRVVPEGKDPAIREIVHGAYRIIYEVHQDSNTLSVLRFWHGARDEPQIPRGA